MNQFEFLNHLFDYSSVKFRQSKNTGRLKTSSNRSPPSQIGQNSPQMIQIVGIIGFKPSFMVSILNKQDAFLPIFKGPK